MKGRPFSDDVVSEDGSGQLQVKRVLMVDGEPGIRLSLAGLLSRAWCVVDVADDRSHVSGMMAQRRYDALRVVLIIGDTADHNRRDSGAAVGNPLTEKPFDLAELQRQLQSLFDDEGGDMKVTLEDRRRARDTPPDGQRRAGPRRSTGEGSSPCRRRRKSSSGEGLRRESGQTRSRKG